MSAVRAPLVAYVGLGANQGNAPKTFALALDALDRLPGVRLGRVSGTYRTEPQGLREQPFFLNQAAALYCERTVSAHFLLQRMLDLEKIYGRVRRTGERKDGPRPLDLDLLLFGQEELNSPGLILPHPRMRRRAFALIPLAEISPELIFPDGESIATALGKIRYRLTGECIFQEDEAAPNTL
ncbi:MAG: 2-amino-4-hydroxy-6-hydroxymethyldihydropteridine diphosphokinase [Deltaproteobacteria bacterium]|jgi:2-amino-4-hydroxy-6-hydroxymethyldihydropteridine diphosphokinase|nr:2-amino-4-hydroxy-6-hydroxymethyldihydropteridine diphosphokinase [Deltaproteobacteria bacterium]